MIKAKWFNKVKTTQKKRLLKKKNTFAKKEEAMIQQ